MSTKQKYAAPWSDGRNGWIDDADGGPVCEYAGCGSHKAEWASDAHFQLVLAAPALLEALEALVSQPVRYNGNWIEIDCGSHSDAMERVRKARAALSLARGEQS